jgi:hypothetical protein
VIRESREGWAPGCYTAVLRHYVVVWVASPGTPRLHLSTMIAVAPADALLAAWRQFHEGRRLYARARIIFSDNAPQPPE